MMQMKKEAMVIQMKNKKPFKPFSKFFKGIYKIIDKVIVTPSSTVVFKIQNKVGKDSKIEKILNQPNVLLYLSLSLSEIKSCPYACIFQSIFFSNFLCYMSV